MSRSAIDLQVNVPDDMPEVVCSQSDLEQVFLNLLANAREATPQGGRIAVTVDVRSMATSTFRSPTPGSGIPARRSAAGARTVLHHQAARQRSRLSICRSVLWEVDGTSRFRARLAAARTCAFVCLQAASQPHPQWS